MYNYKTERHKIFTELGQEMFLSIRDNTHKLLADAGAVSMGSAISGCTGGDSWTMLACVDRLVELGEIKEVDRGSQCPGQHRVFVKPRQ
jgi:hypothetical protein